MKNRTISLLAGLCMAASLFTACSSSTPTSTPSSSVPSASSSKSLEPVTLRFLSFEPSQEAVHKKIAAKYKETHPNIDVTFEYPALADSGSYQAKVNTMILGGEPIDVVVNTYFPDFVIKSQDGMYIDLNSYFTAEGTTYDKEYSFDLKLDGKTYGLPWGGKTYLVFINKTRLDEVGLPIPNFDWTWDDYKMYAQKLTKGSGKDTSFGSFMYNDWAHYFNWGIYTSKMGTPYFNDNGSLYYDSSPFLKLRWDMENVDKSQMPSSVVLSSKMNQDAAYFGGKAAMVIHGTWAVSSVRNTTAFPHDFVTAFATVPRFAGEKVGQRLVETRYFNIPKTSKHPKETYDFIRYYTTDGISMDGKGLSSAKNAGNPKDAVIAMADNNASKLYDMDSLLNCLINEKIIPNPWNACPKSTLELDKLRIEVSNAYLTGGITLDQVEKKWMADGQAIMNRNK